MMDEHVSFEDEDLDLVTWADCAPPLSHEPPVDIWTLHNVGFMAQYFTVGLVFGALPATLYGFLLGYLGVEAQVYATASVLVLAPWGFKFVFGALSDCVPLFGYKRKGWLTVGWGICSTTLVMLSMRTIPAPLRCRDSSGQYTGGICNPDAPNAAGEYVGLMAFAALGYVLSDVCADALTVTYARREPLETRGTIQTTVYLVRTIGQVVAQLFIGLGMNSHEYLGEFDQGLSFNGVCGALAVPCILMIPVSWYAIAEPIETQDPPSCGAYMRSVWQLLRSKTVFYVVLFTFGCPVIGGISTPAGALVMSRWVKVTNLQRQMFAVAGSLMFALGLLLVQKHCLNRSWRAMLVWTTLAMTAIDSLFVFMAVFDVSRNPWVFSSEDLIVVIPSAAAFMIGAWVAVEVAETGTEGITFGMLSSIGNLSAPVSRAIANTLYAAFTPSLSLTPNYDADTPEFRNTVAGSFGLQYALVIASLGFVLFLPRQKQETQLRLANWPQRDAYAWVTVVALTVVVTFSVVANVLVLVPSTSCMRLLGGQGC